jgi:hypothetical protein
MSEEQADLEARLRQMETVLASVQGWVNHTRYGNTIGLRKAVLNRS